MGNQHLGASEALGCIARQERYAQDLLALVPPPPRMAPKLIGELFRERSYLDR